MPDSSHPEQMNYEQMDYQELLRAQEHEEQKDRPVATLNAAWFFAPLLVSPLTHRL